MSVRLRNVLAGTTSRMVPVLLVSAVGLSGCIGVAEKYRDSNKGRRAYDLYAPNATPAVVDVPKLIDPLGLGLARMPKEPGSASDRQAAGAQSSPKDSTPEQIALQAAVIGFYDPAYVNLYKQRPGQPFVWTPVHATCKANCEFRKTRTTTTVTTEVGVDRLDSKGIWTKPIILSKDVDTDVVVENNPPPLTDVEIDQTGRRNNIQDNLIRASNASCNEFKDNLLLVRADTGFLASASSVIFGALGAAAGAVGAVGAAPILAGASGASAGVGEAFDSAYFQEQVTKIIIDGIDAKRVEALTKIAKRREEGISSYGIDAAIGDIETYHGACSIRSGLDKAEKTLAQRIEEIKGRLDTRLESLTAPPEPEDGQAGGGGGGGAPPVAAPGGNAGGTGSGSGTRVNVPRGGPPAAGF